MLSAMRRGALKEALNKETVSLEQKALLPAQFVPTWKPTMTPEWRLAFPGNWKEGEEAMKPTSEGVTSYLADHAA